MSSVYTINKYLFSRPEITSNLSISNRQVTSFADAPVHPLNEQPESTAPYVIYTSRVYTGANHWWQYEDRIIYWLFDINLKRMNDLARNMINYLGRQDASAQEINEWAVANNEFEYKLLYCDFNGTSDDYPEDQEGGVIGKMMSFSIGYVECELPSITTT